MAQISTYVFMDMETTGLPEYEGNKTKIIELSMIAVKRSHVLDVRAGTTPRVQQKIVLCFNPRRLVQPESTEVHGLCNDLLEHETDFNLKVFDIISTFLEVLQKPVCLIAQNGLCFDFPILKRQFEILKTSLSEDILCADSFHGFYDILTSRDKCLNITTEALLSESGIENTLINKNPGNDTSMQSRNETTPKQPIICNMPVTPRHGKDSTLKAHKARRRLPWSQGERPKTSFKLEHVYERLVNRPALNAHRAETDCLLMLECVGVIAKEFVKWVDENHCPFAEVRPMTIGVKVGY